MRHVSSGQVIFAAAMIGLGLIGLITGDFVGVWSGVPESFPGRAMLPYACALVALAGGIGLLWPLTATFAARALFAVHLLWLFAIKAPLILRAPEQEVVYQTSGETAVIVAAAWIVYTQLASDSEKQRLSFIAGELGVRIARVLFGLALIAFGFSHFVYLQMTAPLVPAWLGAPVFWAYFTGAAYLAAGLAVLTGLLARLASALTTLQMGLFALLIWAPRVLAGGMGAFQSGEVVATCVLTASAWVVTESYRGRHWLALRSYSASSAH